MNVYIKLPLTVVTVGFALVSCVKQQAPEPMPVSFGTVEASVNDQPWEATYYYYHFLNDYIWLQFSLYRNGVRKNRLTIKNIPKAIGEYTKPSIYIPGDSIHIFQAKFATYRADGDVPGNAYILDTNLISPLLSIIKYDPVSEELEGHFELGFVIDTTIHPKWDPSLPDTMIFTDGYFHTSLSGSGVEMQ